MADANGPVRLPLAVSLSARAGSLSTDSLMENCFPEPAGNNGTWATKRPGLSLFRAFAAGTGLGVYYWQGSDYTIVGTTLYKNGSTLATVNGASAYQFSHTQDNQTLVLKNNAAMYVVTVGGVVTQVTDPDYPAATVPGLVYLDGTFYVMTTDGAIVGSDIETPTSWNALNRILLSIDPSTPVALVKQLNYVLALSQTAVEAFYDAGNPTGSPLSRYDSAYYPVGCAASGSVASLETDLYFVSRSSKAGSSVYRISNTQTQRISSPYVDKIIEADTLATVYSFTIRIRGQGFYVLSLPGSNLSLVYNAESQDWQTWSWASQGVAQQVTALTWSNNLATATLAGHGLSDGSIVQIQGATPATYNGYYVVGVPDANTFTFPVYASSVAAATGVIEMLPYTTGYFPFVGFESNANSDILQHVSLGQTYAMASGTYLDGDRPIPFRCRTTLLDGGGNQRKYFADIDLIGDKISAAGYLRHTDTDYQTFSVYRPVDMSLSRTRWRRNGQSRRRAFEFLHVASTDCRVLALELTVMAGSN